MSPSPATDVVIVGAGPVGLVAAELARRGARIGIIETLAAAEESLNLNPTRDDVQDRVQSVASAANHATM
ncbi:hypothetical protein BH11ACT6_BH11ACT6_23410 [soil metagenome]